MTTATPRSRRAATLATVASATLLAALVLAGPAALTARAATSSLAGPALTVARGTTSAQSSGWNFSEAYPGEFPLDGFSIVIAIRPYSGDPSGISFDQTSAPVFSGPSSLGGSASFAGPRTLRIDLESTNPLQFESFSVTGLRLRASEDCGLGPVIASYTNPGFDGNFGPLPAIATAGGTSPTPTPSPAPSRTPTPTTSPTPQPTATPPHVVVTTAAARVAAGRPGAYTTPFRTSIAVTGGSRVTVRATVRPADAGRSVSLYRRSGTSGTWRIVTTVRIDAAGTATVVTRATLPATWRGARQVQYRWFLAATESATAAWSDIARVAVR